MLGIFGVWPIFRHVSQGVCQSSFCFLYAAGKVLHTARSAKMRELRKLAMLAYKQRKQHHSSLHLASEML